ncbi:MAG: glycosyltransferase [Microbacterium sp.]
MVVLLGYDQDPVRWRERHAAGETLDETPYGYELAREWCDVQWAQSQRESALVTRIRRRIAAKLGYDLVHAWRNRRLIREADIVWTHTEREHLAVAALPLRRRPAVIAQSVWLWDEWPEYSERRRRRVARLLRRHSAEITLSPVNAALSAASVPGRRVAFVPFGTRTAVGPDDSPAADDTDRPTVFAPGNDVHRDWALLCAVAEKLPQVAFRVATRRAAALGLPWPSNVDARPSTVAELRELYAASSAVAVPLRANAHASGITVCIEALDAGKPLVVSRVGGIEAYVEGCAHLAAESDVTAFAAAIVAAVSERSPSSDVVRERGLTQEDYVRRFVRLTRALLDDEWDDAVTALAAVPRP